MPDPAAATIVRYPSFIIWTNGVILKYLGTRRAAGESTSELLPDGANQRDQSCCQESEHFG